MTPMAKNRAGEGMPNKLAGGIVVIGSGRFGGQVAGL